MSGFSSWVLSIAGICVLGVLVDLVMPEGQTNKYVKSVFAVFVILIIVSPLPSIVKRGSNTNSISIDENIVLQDDFIFKLNRDRLDSIEEEIENEISSLGIDNIEIMLSANVFTLDMQIEAVFVDLTNVVIREESEHININEVVSNVVLARVNLEKEKIVFSE